MQKKLQLGQLKTKNGRTKALKGTKGLEQQLAHEHSKDGISNTSPNEFHFDKLTYSWF